MRVDAVAKYSDWVSLRAVFEDRPGHTVVRTTGVSGAEIMHVVDDDVYVLAWENTRKEHGLRSEIEDVEGTEIDSVDSEEYDSNMSAYEAELEELATCIEDTVIPALQERY